ncbi:hypothetical protein M404DRAFT_21095 [Pisolithus tinctorius Marx 270]|uniref:Uncharacterized protein n=1 Tax=Pisolithus tinctorius Marx 270 TaxID=870435 RepID=A0A0C3PB67_PISTI|nr:hypothetical protein M404DRAFT_21095 [Pisolithus tinctorius Marx 270]
MSYTPNTENPGSDYFDNDFHADIDEPYDPSHPYFDHYASTPPHLSEPPVHPHRVLCSPSPMVSPHSAHGSAYQPLHDSVASTMRPYPYPVICSVPSLQALCKDAHKGKSKAHSGPPEPHYDASFRSCNTPPLSQASYRSPSPISHSGASAPAPSVSLANLSAPTATPTAPATSTSRMAPKASLFEALKTQDATVKIVHKDFGPSLISSFHSFLDGLPQDIVRLPSDPHREEAQKVKREETNHSGPPQHGPRGAGEANRDVELRCRGCWGEIIPGRSQGHFQAIADTLSSILFNGTPHDWLDFFTQAQGGSAGRALFYAFQTSGALPATPFVPVPISALSKRELGGLVPVDWQHPLHQFTCYQSTNSEIRSWVEQGLYPPSEDLRP